MVLKMCSRLDEKFEKFEHNIAFLGMEMAELYKEYAKLKEKFCGQIALLENEVKKLREQNGILKSRLMNNTTEDGEQNSAHDQFLANNNGILNIVERKDIVEVIGISSGTSMEQQSEFGQQIEEQNQHYTTNPMDNLNETLADGFGQIEEDGYDEEEGEGIMPDDSLEMDGISERMGDLYDNNLSPRDGPSHIDANEDDGEKQQYSKKKRKFLKCQWPGCGYRKAKCKADMERHWRTHTGERPYSCTICGKSFSRLNIMKKHELREHNLI